MAPLAHTGHRKDIDGLRAIAVTAVIIHHAGFTLHGGFLGVDIFFVISGFLITGILLRDMEAGRFSLRDFYHRRVRRILPALVFIALCTVPVAWVLMPPEQFAHYGRSLVALPLFATNFLFWREAGYFAPSAAEIPMIHTWSLAVEEQFYIFFPLALLLVWRLGRRWILPLLIVGVVVGLALAEYGVRTRPSAAFYLLPFRAWELLAGAVAAYMVFSGAREGAYYAGLRRVPEAWNGALSGLGMVAILASLWFFLPTSGSPGYTVVPLVAGTMLLLLFTTPQTWVYRALSLRGMVWIGLISYSAYLWHQPLFAFARIASFEPPAQSLMLGLIAMTFGLAWLSWQLIEEPFRRQISGKWVYGTVVTGFTALAALGVVAHVTKGLPDQRFAAQQVQWFLNADNSPRRADCHDRPDRLGAPGSACVYSGEAAPSWAVLGDSHGVEIAYALSQALSPRGETLVHLTASACPAAYTYESERAGCQEWTRRSVDWLAEQPNIETVVLAYRHVGHLYPTLGPALEATGSPKIIGGGTDAEKRALYWEGFAAVVNRLAEAGKAVIILEPVPEIHVDIDKYIARAEPERTELQTISRADYDKVLGWLTPQFAPLPARLLSPAQTLCDDNWCYGARDGVSFYFDNNHPSVAGAARIIETLSLP